MRQTNNNNNNNSTYVPPNKRQLANNLTASPRAEKKEPKKELQLNNPALFPTLSGSSLSSTQQQKPFISFSSAVAKRIEADKEEVKKSDVDPGWVHIRKHKGTIQFKNGPPMPFIDYTEQEDKFICDKLYKYRLARQQYDQDMDVMRLGDLSDYYGEPTLVEIQEAYEEEEKYWASKNYSGNNDSDESGDSD
jgi:hypothetical protein